MRRPAILALSLLTMLALAVPVASANDSRGSEFWLTFPTNHSNTPELTLFITSETAASGTVEIPGLAFTEDFVVAAGDLTSVVVPSGAEIATGENGTVIDRGIHVTSDAEVTVYGLNRFTFTTDAYLGLPIDILGTDYLVIGYGGGSGGEFAVVGTEDDTTVTIDLSEAAHGESPGVPYEVTLDEGQVYGAQAGGGDLSGTEITSDKPVAVFGGNACTNIPPGFSACDHIVEQLVPVGAWGESFVTAPLATRLNGDTFRIMASDDGTVVSINGAEVATLNRGEFHEQLIDGGATITATGPVQVMQYSNGTSFDGVTSDPFQMSIPAEEQFLNAYTVSTPASGFDPNFVNVVAPDSAVGDITLDGVAIPSGDFTAIGSSGFSYAQAPVDLGAHRLEGPEPFGVYSYGFASFDSYGYPGGSSVAQIASVESITLSPSSQLAVVGNQACVIAQALDGEDAPVPGVRIDLDTTGAHPASTFAFADSNGEAEFCSTGTTGGVDTAVASVGALESNSAQITWVDDVVLTIDPPDQELEVGTEGCVTITVTDGENPIPNADIVVTLTGLVEQDDVATTNEDGQVEYCVTSPDPGEVTIVGSIGEFSSPEATIEWSELLSETGSSLLLLTLLATAFTGSGTLLLRTGARRLRQED